MTWTARRCNDRFSYRTPGWRHLRAGVLFVLGIVATGCGAAIPAGGPPAGTLSDTICLTAVSVTQLDAAGLASESERRAASGQDEAAVAYLQAAAEQANTEALWRQVAQRRLQRGEWQSAFQALETLLRLQPGDPEAAYWLGVILTPYSPRQAFDSLSEILLDDPDYGADAEILRVALSGSQLESPAMQAFAMGEALLHLEHWPQAEQAYDIAVTLSPEFSQAWAYLGLTQARQGKDGTLALDRAMALAPEDTLILYLSGVVARIQGNPEESLAALQEAQRLAPDNPGYAAELGYAYQAIGDLATAEEWFRKALQLARDDSGFLKILALFYADEAFNLQHNGLTLLREAAARLPDDADVQAAYGWGMYLSGERTQANTVLRAALALDPQSPRTLYYLGLFELTGGNSAEGQRLLGQLLSLPDSQGFAGLARRALARLEG